jgi:hypothetical protein
MTYYGYYCRGNPEGYLMFLNILGNNDPSKMGLFIWVDNDDHAVSKEFYQFRKLIKRIANTRGIETKVFINPKVADKATMESWVQEQLPGHTIMLKYEGVQENNP